MRNLKGFGWLPVIALLGACGCATSMWTDRSPENLFWTAPLLLLSLWLVLRWPFIRVQLMDGEIVRHGWLMNRRIDREAVASVTSEPTGFVERIPFAGLVCVRIGLLSGEAVQVTELLGNARTAEQLADELRTALGIPMGERRAARAVAEDV